MKRKWVPENITYAWKERVVKKGLQRPDSVIESYRERYERERFAKASRNIAMMLYAFRALYNLSKLKMVSLLLHHGIAGVNWQTYYRWENGEQKPQPIRRQAIEDALDQAAREFNSVIITTALEK